MDFINQLVIIKKMWVYWCTVEDSFGNRYSDSDFMKVTDGETYQCNWEMITELMQEHCKHLGFIECGFGGDDLEGTVALKKKEIIPDMNFEAYEKKFIMHFGNGFEQI